MDDFYIDPIDEAKENRLIEEGLTTSGYVIPNTVDEGFRMSMKSNAQKTLSALQGIEADNNFDRIVLDAKLRNINRMQFKVGMLAEGYDVVDSKETGRKATGRQKIVDPDEDAKWDDYTKNNPPEHKRF